MHYVKYLTSIFFLVGCLAVNAASTSLVESTDISPQPLRIGETLTYDIRWNRLPAGKRTDWITEVSTVKDASLYHIRSEMKTRALFRFYSFQNQQETYFNPSTLAPVRFRNHVQDRTFRATVAIDFREAEAAYERISQKNSAAPQKREVKTLTIPVGTQDELSTLYFLRSKELALGETYFFPVVVKGEVQKVTLTVERKEVVKNKTLGSVRTLVLKTSKGDRFWLTDDKRRLPVKMEAKSKMGAFKATLTRIEFAN